MKAMFYLRNESNWIGNRGTGVYECQKVPCLFQEIAN